MNRSWNCSISSTSQILLFTENLAIFPTHTQFRSQQEFEVVLMQIFEVSHFVAPSFPVFLPWFLPSGSLKLHPLTLQSSISEAFYLSSKHSGLSRLGYILRKKPSQLPFCFFLLLVTLHCLQIVVLSRAYCYLQKGYYNTRYSTIIGRGKENQWYDNV